MKVITNHVHREVLRPWDLTPAERQEFDYLDWKAIDAGEDSASFVRYRGSTYDLGEFTANYGITKGTGLPEALSGWHGYLSESAFSAVVVRFPDDDTVVVGLVLS